MGNSSGKTLHPSSQGGKSFLHRRKPSSTGSSTRAASAPDLRAPEIPRKGTVLSPHPSSAKLDSGSPPFQEDLSPISRPSSMDQMGSAPKSAFEPLGLSSASQTPESFASTSSSSIFDLSASSSRSFSSVDSQSSPPSLSKPANLLSSISDVTSSQCASTPDSCPICGSPPSSLRSPKRLQKGTKSGPLTGSGVLASLSSIRRSTSVTEIAGSENTSSSAKKVPLPGSTSAALIPRSKSELHLDGSSGSGSRRSLRLGRSLTTLTRGQQGSRPISPSPLPTILADSPFGSASEFKAQYALKRVLNRGASGVVKLCIDKKTGEKLACKSIAMKGASQEEQEDVRAEVAMMRAVAGSPLIVGLRGAFEDKEAGTVHLVMDLCDGGDLASKLESAGGGSGRGGKQTEGRMLGAMTEFEAAKVFRDVVAAVKFAHSRGVMHRDLKPENVLLVPSSSSSPSSIKLADFGVAIPLLPGQKTTGVKGTQAFFAPEMLSGPRGEYGLEADVWSLGVLLFLCLTGQLPFSLANGNDALYAQIRRGTFSFACSTAGRGVSGQAKDLVQRMLTVNPKQRASLEQVLGHAWLRVE